MVGGDLEAARVERDLAAELAAGLDDLEDRAVVEGDLATLRPVSDPAPAAPAPRARQPRGLAAAAGVAAAQRAAAGSTS